jgi:uncharacterized protein
MMAAQVRLSGAFALALAIILGISTAGRADDLQTLKIVTASGTHRFEVEVAVDDESRERGLMNRRYLPRDRGMLFEFPREAPVSFWMKNTYIPLDMIFISRSGLVTNVVANAEPLSERVIPSGPACSAVLELNGGAAAAIGVRIGDKVEHPFFE